MRCAVPRGVEAVNAMYAFTRSLALALAATVVLFTHSPSWLRAVAFAMVLVQAGDRCSRCTAGQPPQDRWPALTAVANLIALAGFVG